MFTNYNSSEAKIAAREILTDFPDDLMAIFDRFVDKMPFVRENEFRRFCYNLRSKKQEHDGHRILKYHLQAMDVCPSLYHSYPGVEYEAYERERRDLMWQEIAEGKPLVPAVLPYFHALGCASLEDKHLKRMLKFDEPVNPFLFNKLVDNLPLDFFPRNKEELELFEKIDTTTMLSVYSMELMELTDRASEDSTILYADLSKFSHRQQESFRAMLEKKPFDTLGDTTKFIAENLAACLVQNDPKRDPANDIYMAGKVLDTYEEIEKTFSYLTPFDLMDMNTRHHQHWAIISRALQKFDDAAGVKLIEKWAAKFPKADAGTLPALGPYTIVPLLSRKELQAEHERMNHCVDSYAPNCILGKSLIFSVRDKKGNSLSTFELNDEGTMLQHRAFENAEPPEREQKAVAAYIEAIKTGNLKEDKLYSAWLSSAHNLTMEEIYGYSYAPPYARAELAIEHLLKYKIIPAKMVAALQGKGLLPSAQIQDAPAAVYEPL